MGCFDSVCSFSKIPVHTGDKVVAQHVFSGLEDSMPDGRWGQIGLPLFGEYDDYGGLEEFDTEHINYKILSATCEEMKSDIRLMDRCQYDNDKPDITEIFMKNVVCGEQVLSTYRKKAEYKKSDRDNGTYEIGTHTGNSAYLCFIHKAVYDHVISVGSAIGESSISGADIDTYFDIRRKNAKEGKVIYILDSMVYDEDNFTLDSMKDVERFEFDSSVGKVHSLLFRRMNDCYPSMSNESYKAINTMMKKLMPELSYEHPFVKTLIENKNFRWGKMALNLEWVPHFSYVLNQYRESSDLHRMRDFHKMSAKVATSLIRRDDDQ